MQRTIVILGSTGSIGENAIWVARALNDELTISGVAAGRRWKRVAEQVQEFGCRRAAIAEPSLHARLKQAVPSDCEVTSDHDGLIAMVTAPEVDMVLCAITGTAGLLPVLAAIRAGKDIALASKEVLVMAGELVMGEARRCGSRILPVDSEHSAIFQCLEGHAPDTISRLILTASGGPFRTLSQDEMAEVSYQQALAHPTWNMGPKVTIDSASLMNKALELVEARWLFDTVSERIDVLIHPQSIVHSMIEFIDGGMLAQLGCPDMRLPIQVAFMYPERRSTGLPHCDLFAEAPLEFEEPDRSRFPSLDIARFALKKGGTMPSVMNAANEVAVEAFARGAISFPAIWEVISETMSRHTPLPQDRLEDILDSDRWARVAAGEAVDKHAR